MQIQFSRELNYIFERTNQNAMRSLTFLTIILILIYMDSYSQADGWEWAVQSYSAGYNQAMDIVVDNENNYYLSGHWNMGNFQVGDSVFPGDEGDFTSFIAGYDREGNFRWARDLPIVAGSPYGMVANCLLAIDSHQNLYATGTFDFTVDFGDTILYSEGNWDIFVAKYDSAGNFGWAYHIGGPCDDQVRDIKIDDKDMIYVGMDHGRPLLDNYIVYGNDDSTVYFRDYATSVLALDEDAGFSWLSCGYTGSGVETDNLALDKDNNLYAGFFIFGAFMLNGDTIFADQVPYTHLIIPYGPDGIPGDCLKFPHSWVGDMVIDSQGDFILTGVFNEPLVIGGDTLVPVFYYDRLLVKYDPLMEPLWYMTFPNQTYTNDFSLDLGRNDEIYIGAPFDGNVVLNDTTLMWEGMKGLFLAEFLPEGDLQRAIPVPAGEYFYSSTLNADHCGNILFGGGFIGEIHFDDFILECSGDHSEVFMAKLSNTMGFLDLGPDTVACGSLLLSAPEGYSYYSWNDGASQEDHFIATETGQFTLFAVDEHYCTDSDTIFVEIIPMPVVDLGNDTLIFISDTLTLTVTSLAGTITWSDGSAGIDFIFRATDYGEGTHLVWAKVNENGCETIDSINIQVIDNSFLDEATPLIGRIYPNPANDWLNIDFAYTGLVTNSDLSFEVLDLQGTILVVRRIENPRVNNHPDYAINISHLATGMYFLLVRDGRKVIDWGRFVVKE